MQKRPIFEEKETFAKETCVYMKSHLCVYEKRPIFIWEQPYMYTKRDPSLNTKKLLQKKLACTSKETYVCMQKTNQKLGGRKRDLHLNNHILI